MKKLLLFSFHVLICFGALAQSGTIRGKVIDDATGESMIGVTVAIKGTTQGAVTDFEGAFSIKVAAGTYDLEAAFISYQKVTVTGVSVENGEVTNIGTIRLKEDIETLEDVVVVTAEAIKSSEAALLTVKKKSPILLDGISAETFSRIGDSDAGGAIKRVPGVSLQGGQYVFVRGLGDRYTKTVLNGVEVPGLDPDRNSIQIDIFPTNIIGNIMVYKTFTPDLSADFVGGTVNIETNDFPEEKTLNLSLSTEYNPSMHLKSNFLTYQGGDTDFLGIDDGTRELPFDSKDDDIPIPGSQNERVNEITERFDQTMGVMQSSNLPNMSISLSAGNQFDLKKYNIGYNAAASYSKSSQFYEDALDAYYIKPNLSDELELELDTEFIGPLGITDVQWNALLGGAIKSDRSKISMQAMHIQNGIERAAKRVRVRANENSNVSIVDNLEYTERALTNFILKGNHNLLSNSSLEIEWAGSATIASIDDKDVRITPFTVNDDDGSLSIQPTEGGEPNRIWRTLDEDNYVGKLDITKNFELFGNSSKIKAGASQIYKEREFRIDDFFLTIRGNQNDINLNGDPNQLLTEENVIDPETGLGVAIQDRFVASNSYEGRISISSAYIMGELGITEKLKTILGVRMELYDQYYTGLNQEALAGGPAGRVFDDEKVLNLTDFFPSLNLIYSVQDNSNLRASFSRTTARPSFKELSTAEIQDVLTGRTFIGNIDLKPTYINNYDLRYELFFRNSQTISVGAFYKTFEDPIELVRQTTQPTDFKPTNVGDASIIGAELEFRKDLDFISPALANLSFSSNLTWTSAKVEIDSSERAGRINGLRDGESLDDERDFLGQPPFIINVSLNYTDLDAGWEGSLSFNRQSSTLAVVGINRVADTYTVPFNSLNLNITKRFGADRKNKLGLRVTNILGDVQEREFRSFQSDDYLEFSRDPGTAFRVQYVRSLF